MLNSFQVYIYIDMKLYTGTVAAKTKLEWAKQKLYIGVVIFQ